MVTTENHAIIIFLLNNKLYNIYFLYDQLLTMAKSGRRAERRHLNKLLNNGGVSTDGNIKVQHDLTCCVCLDDMNTGCYPLDCGHCFHSNCVLEWYKKSSSKDMRFVTPFTDLDIQFFPVDTNCMKCPVCKTQYTKELALDKVTEKVSQKDTTMKRILGKITMVFFDDETRSGKRSIFMTHYVTNVDTFKLFKPVFDIHDDNGESVTLYKRL